MSWFENITPLPPDPVLGLYETFRADPRKKKLDLTVGSYRNDALQPVVFEAVKMAEATLIETEKNKEYLPIAGDPFFLDRIGRIVFGSSHWAKYKDQVSCIQTAGGTGALRIGGEFLRSIVEGPVYIPTPTWPNHRHVMHQSGFKTDSYPYYDSHHHQINFDKLCEFCETLSPSSVLLLHLNCHNPTGCDLSLEQWKALSKIMRKKQIFPLLDCAYQGFGDGLEKDMQGLSILIQDGHEFAMAYSCSKNFSLYCERIGAFFVFTHKESVAKTILSVLRMKTRGIISNPPAHGARIISCILETPALEAIWRKELDVVLKRLHGVREELATALGEEFSFVRQGKGLYCVTGLHGAQIERLRNEFGIYMTMDGRINLAGLNSKAIGLLADAMQKVR